jgi:outer membrane protein
MRWGWLVGGILCLASSARGQESLTVDDAVAIARKNHPDIGAQEAALQAQRARKEQAASGFWPGATGNFTYNPQTPNYAPTPGYLRLQRSSNGVFMLPDGTILQCAATAQGVPSPNCMPGGLATQRPDYALDNYWLASVGLWWNLFDFGRTYYNWRSARSGFSAQKYAVDSTEQAVVLAVKVAFFNAIAAEASVRVSVDALQTQQRHLDQARAFYQVGARTRIDVAQSISDLANAELTLARARGNLESARALLQAALGVERWRTYTLIEPPLTDLPLPDEPALFDEALRNRPEPKELKLRARSFEELRKSARGGLFPSLILQAGPNWAGEQVGALITNFTATVSLTYPLTGMNPYLVVGQMHEAEATRRQILEQQRGVENQIRLEAAEAHAAMVQAREELQASAKLVTAARDRRDLAEGRYQTGVGSIIELSDAQLNYVNAEFQEVQSRLDLSTAKARLEHALGRDH